jgi:NMD protein affecting ribosome stability and mRNA decay
VTLDLAALERGWPLCTRCGTPYDPEPARKYTEGLCWGCHVERRPR